MNKILKSILLTLVGLPVAAVAAYWFFATSAERKADATDISASQKLVELASEFGVTAPRMYPLDCDEYRYSNNARLKKLGSSLSFNGLVEEARSAESAAIRFKGQGDDRMAAIATADAVERWRQVWEMKAEMNCNDLQTTRRSY
jgi:hypothetical protein